MKLNAIEAELYLNEIGYSLKDIDYDENYNVVFIEDINTFAIPFIKGENKQCTISRMIDKVLLHKKELDVILQDEIDYLELVTDLKYQYATNSI